MNGKLLCGVALILSGCQPGGGGGAQEVTKPTADSATSTGNEVVVTVDEAQRIPLEFVDVCVDVGITGPIARSDEECPSFAGSGSAWADVDMDGDVDLFLTNHGGPNYLYRNVGDRNGDGLPDFVDIATALGIAEPDKQSHAAVFVDYDNDGDQDLYVTNRRVGNTLWQNRLVPDGALAFVDETPAAGVADEGRAITSAWGDLDRDGFLDLYLAKHANCLSDYTAMPADRLYHQRGDGTFENWSTYLCAGSGGDCYDVTGLGFTAGFLDHDNDGDLDIYLVNDSTHGGGPNRHWRNDGPDGYGGWLLPEVSSELGTDTRLNGMGLGVGDLDNDGWLDLAFSNIGSAHVLHNRGDGSYEDITESCGVAGPTSFLVSWGTAFFDADNDGWLDLYFANGALFGNTPQPDSFFRNNRDRTFRDYSVESRLDGPRKGRALSTVDFNEDGFIDVFVGNLGQQPNLYLNLGPKRHSDQHWLAVTVEGTLSNRDGIGTRLWLTTTITQVREISSGPSHGGGDQRAATFGLGLARSGDLRVRWPSGIEQALGTVAADQRLHLVEP